MNSEVFILYSFQYSGPRPELVALYYVSGKGGYIDILCSRLAL